MNKRSAEITRRNILTAAQSVFTEQGYAGANMRNIARVAGTSVGGLYIHFRNKEELYLTLMQDRMKKLSELTEEALSKIDNPTEALEAFIAIGIDFARRNREMIILEGRELGFSFGIGLKRDFLNERRRMLAQIIGEGIDRGEFRECDAGEMAWIIINMLRGFVVSMVIDEESPGAPGGYIDLALRGMLGRNGG